MAAGRTSSRIATIVVAVIAALSIGGLITTVAVSAFLDKFDAYGEVPIPGTSTVYLPSGEVSADFHVRSSHSSTAVPPLHINIAPPPGGKDPEFKDDLGASVSNSNDVHRRVWLIQVPTEGGYRVEVDGPVGDFTEPRLAFGRTSSSIDGLVWVFTAFSVVSVDLLVALWWLRRRGRLVEKPSAAADPFVPTDEGVRLEQLKTIAGLRDSGALTEDEYKAEKRRILEGH